MPEIPFDSAPTAARAARLPLSRDLTAALVVDGSFVLSVEHVGAETHLLIVFQIPDFPAIVADESGVPFFNEARSLVVVY